MIFPSLVAHTEALPEIASKWPISDLLSFEILSSVWGHVLIQFIFQICLFFAVEEESWYTEPAYDVTGVDVSSDQNTVLFLFTLFVYISLSMILAVGPPFRKYVWTNGKLNSFYHHSFLRLVPYLVCFILLTAFSLFLLFITVDSISVYFSMRQIGNSYRFTILLVVSIYFIVAYIWEQVCNRCLRGFINRFILVI